LNGTRFRLCILLIASTFFAIPYRCSAQEYSVKAVDEQGHALSGIPITLRYSCTFTGSGTKIEAHCKYIQRRMGDDGIAHFPEAGSLKDLDDIYSLPITYGMVCCDISQPVIPGSGVMRFRRRSLGEMLNWIFVGN
jgi:hypothetical protein